MVLKRKQDGEFVPWMSSSQEQTQPAESPAKKARTNPPRSSRSTTSYAPQVAPKFKPPLTKKARAPRSKKAPATTAVASSSSPLQPGPSQIPTPKPAPAKRGRKKADPNAEPSGSQPEKRQAKFKPACPQNILDRVERVRTQRIFMIDRNRVDNELREEFSVLGSTGNVYTVTIDHVPRCNCPDSVKGNHCKHILFIFLKVLQVSQQSGFWYQKALLTSELEQIFAEAPLAPNSLAHAHIREAHARATGKAPAVPVAAGTSNKRIPGPDDDCPICYDGMHGVAQASLVFCEECGNALHKECFREWQKTAATNGKELTCVWCRASWIVARPAGAAGAGGVKRVAGGYLNLASVANTSPVRDTSTYYHGPRRGQRYYGYQNYDD